MSIWNIDNDFGIYETIPQALTDSEKAERIEALNNLKRRIEND